MHRTKQLVCMSVLSMSLAGTGVSAISPAQAQVTSDQMTCSQAVATYERNGRIYVRTRSGTVLPIYRGVPVSRKSQLNCQRRWSQRTPYNVRTKDARNCTIAYVCQ